MAGAHASPPARGPRSRRRGPGPPAPASRSRRAARSPGIGWWQAPRPGRGRRVPANAPVRDTETDTVEITGSGLGRPGRPWQERAAGLLPARLRGAGPRSHHRRPQTPEQRRAGRRRMVRNGIVGGIAAAVLGPVLLFALGYLFFTVPSPDDAVNNQVALVSYADGTQLTRLVEEEGNRIKVEIGQVPEHVRQAVLAAEDRTFHSNPGFDLTGIMRAAWSQLRGGSGGGSTITQQFVKNALVGDAPTLWRKYKEVVLAVKISQERSKDEILRDYLNAIYFGRGAYGIQSASLAFFDKDVEELTPSEGAMLAGLIQSPSRWDPAVDRDRAVGRWNFVLDGMASQGWLSSTERAGTSFPQTVERRPQTGGVPSDPRGHIVTAVRAELAELGISEQDLSQEGLRITTTIDPVRQDEAVEAARQALDRQPENLRAAMVAVDPQTGGVLAYYGGENGLGLDYARVRRLAGSTFKPFVVLAGLLQPSPVGLGEVYNGVAGEGLRNAEGAECERCDLKQAMTISNNVIFTTLAAEVGPQAVADAARTAGITAPLDDPDARIALGNKEVSTFELASAYATIAAGGVWHQPHLVAEVVTADGRVLYEAATEGERRFPERVARNVTESMLAVAERDGLAIGDRPVAAKTGTVQSRYEGENNDAWMAGFTPGLATSVWVGTDMNSPIRTAGGTPISGKGLPGEVWSAFMREALVDEPVQEFVPFTPIGEAPSGLAPDEVPEPTGPATAEPTPEPPVEAPPPDVEPLPPGGPDAAPGPGPAPDPRAAGPEEPVPTPAPDTPLVQPAPAPAPECTVTPCG